VIANWGLRQFARSLWRIPERLLHPLRRRKALRRLRGGPLPRAVLVVCRGNIYRSPYAAGLLARDFSRAEQSAIRVESGGFLGWGRPCPPMAVEVAAMGGLDLSRHRSNQVVPTGVFTADLIVAVDPQEARAVREVFGREAGDVLILGDLDPEPIDTRGIEDPYEQSREVLERSYARIDRCVRQLVQAVADGAERTRSSRGAAPLTQRGLTT
jgi:protein-tyrosine phosphatase